MTTVMSAMRGSWWRDDAGGVALEDVGILPIVLLVVLAGWQMLVVGVSDVMVGRAAGAASREYSVSGSLTSATNKARGALPRPFDDVSVSGGSSITVKLRVPGSLTGVWGAMHVVEASKSVVEEPR